MAGQQKRRERALLVTKALLLGYTIEWCEFGYQLVRPNGNAYFYFIHKKNNTHGPVIQYYPAKWVAAKKALELAGVVPWMPNPITKTRGKTSSGWQD